MVNEDELPWHMRAYLFALDHPSFGNNTKLLNGFYVKGKKWHPPKELWCYFNAYRIPTAMWPNSYLNAATTNKFRHWYLENYKRVFNVSDLEMSVLRAIYIQRSTPHDLSHAPQAQAHA
jgi:hypothetical protein